jgi:hypothetical protein
MRLYFQNPSADGELKLLSRTDPDAEQSGNQGLINFAEPSA